MSSNVNPASAQPLASLDEWEDFLKDKYPEPAPAPARRRGMLRQSRAGQWPGVSALTTSRGSTSG